MILQNFNVTLDDPQYEMRLVQTLTIKPKDFYIRVSLRNGLTPTVLQKSLLSTSSTISVKNVTTEPKLSHGDSKAKMTILYGSNTGTCQTLAQKLSAQASQHGFKSTVADMDSFTGRIPKDQPTIIITASYEGQPPDNAARFVAWLESGHDQHDLKDSKFAVFGCGHSDWNTTFMRIPKLVDEKLGQMGATRLADRGISDAAKRDMFGDFDTWMESSLWPSIEKSSINGKTNMHHETSLPPVKIELSIQKRAQQLQQNCKWAKVVETSVLTAPNTPEKRHTSIELPPEMTYETGDYLAVLPLNPEDSVRRVIKRFDLPWDATITITDAAATVLPINLPLSVSDLLKGYVEILQPATRKVTSYMRNSRLDLEANTH
jgi:cytochrome P450 / NADPH-cytochrome P450 reductase